MNNQTRKYSPAEFIERLKNEEFNSKPLIFVGVLKAAEDEQHLMFANGAYCNNWTSIPVDAIESIELISVIPCKDHSHPLVRLTMKEPASEEAKMFASMALPLTPGFQSHNAGNMASDFLRFTRNPGRSMNEFLGYSGPNEWYPCWSHCMDDLLDFASEQPPEQWKFWTSLAYQLCGQVCP